MSDFQLSKVVDKEKVFLTKLSEVEKRFDPFYYVPSIKELENSIRKLLPEPLRHYVISISSGATPKTTEAEKFYTDDKENGVPFLRVQNLSPTGFLQLDDVKYINKETHNGLLKRSQVSGGDLLVKITGVGRMAVASVAPDDFVGNTNQHMVVIKTKSKELSTIIAAYLNTDIGELLASRRATGGTRPALDYPALLSIPIVYDGEILKITEKAVNKKLQKEAEAKGLLSSIDDYLLKELSIILPEKDISLENRIFTTSYCKVSGGRFDPKLYDNNTQGIRNAVNETTFDKSLLKDLIIHSVAGDWGEDEKEDLGSKYKKCLVIRATEFDNLYNLKLDNSRVKYRLIKKDKLDRIDIQENDLLIEKSGGSPDQPVGRISILRKEVLKKHTIGYSNFIHKIRVDSSKIIPEYLFCFLKTIHNIKLTDAMQSQTNGIRNLIMSNYFNQTIPLPKIEKQIEIADHISNIRDKAKQLENEVQKILEKAKQEVEQIILGKE